MDTLMIKSEHHRGVEKPLWVVLSDLASQEGCDGEPYDEMLVASEYIQKLETMVCDLEKELEPYIETERRLIEKIKKINKRDLEEQKEEEKETIIVGPSSHTNQPELPALNYNEACCICGRSQMYTDMATMTDRCSYCGQKYRRF